MKKNIVFAIYSLLMSFMFLFLNSCDKDDNKIDKSKLIPQLSTAEVKNVRLTSAESGGNITSDGGSSITQRGVCWGLSANPTTKDNKTTDDAEAGAFNSIIKSLASGTTYYLRAYATNGYGTGYGNEFTFTTQKHGSAGKVTDIDGNVYNTIVIGTQEWMAENLKTSKLNDGTHITLEESDVYEEYIRKIPIYSWYDSKESNGRKYGRLYNWYSIASKMLCPVGWHVPTDNEWIVLVDYLGGNKIAGGKMKNIGTDDWASPNKGATNESGFSALPGGLFGDYSSSYNKYHEIGKWGYWGTSSINLKNSKFYNVWFIYFDNIHIYSDSVRDYQRTSIRCIRD